MKFDAIISQATQPKVAALLDEIVKSGGAYWFRILHSRGVPVGADVTIEMHIPQGMMGEAMEVFASAQWQHTHQRGAWKRRDDFWEVELIKSFSSTEIAAPGEKTD